MTIEGEQEVLLVDFQVAQSFGQAAGKSGMWVMRPSIQAEKFETSGGIGATLALGQGVTLPTVGTKQVTLADFSATLTPAGSSDPKVVTLSDSNGDGTFEANFKFLLPGDYSIAFTSPEGVTFTTNPVIPFTMTLGSGKQVSQGFQVTAAGAAQ